MKEMKPCECGGNGFIESILHRYDPSFYFYNEWFVKCIKCGKEGEHVMKDKFLAINLWNRRIQDKQ